MEEKEKRKKQIHLKLREKMNHKNTYYIRDAKIMWFGLTYIYGQNRRKKNYIKNNENEFSKSYYNGDKVNSHQKKG